MALAYSVAFGTRSGSCCCRLGTGVTRFSTCRYLPSKSASRTNHSGRDRFTAIQITKCATSGRAEECQASCREARQITAESTAEGIEALRQQARVETKALVQ